ncbi:MAG: helix-turn-helix domain-containing protein [Planctomycetota bacterium]|jgi:transcriptional regulator with XRE-family HTH domain
MRTFAETLDREIDRRVAAAVREALKPLQAELREEKRRVARLEKELARRGTGSPAAATDWAGKLAGLRARHDLSQRAVAELLGVSLNTVWMWEQGRSRPRAAQAEGLEELGGLSAAALKRRLKAVGLEEGRAKPGRKPKAAAAKPARKAKRKTAKRKPRRRKA